MFLWRNIENTPSYLGHYICRLFSTEAQSQKMVKEYHIYMMKSGRINMCGLTDKNLDYVAKCIKTVVDGKESSDQQVQQGRL